MNSSNKAALLVSGAVVLGFAVGFGIGRETRKSAGEHVTAKLEGGTVTIKANVSGAVGQGINDYLKGVFD